MHRPLTCHPVEACDPDQLFLFECTEHHMVRRIVFDKRLEHEFGIQDFLLIGGTEILRHVFQTRQANLAIDA
jgi:hypothetical protein